MMNPHGWPAGTISHAIVWEEPYLTALGPTKIVTRENFLFWLFEKEFGGRFSKADTSQLTLCGIGLEPQYPTYPCLMRARQEWGSAVIDGEDLYVKEEVDIAVGGGQKVIGFVFWNNDGALIRGAPHIRPLDWDKPENPLSRRFDDRELARKGNSMANTYTVTLNSGEVLHIEAYHLLFKRGTWNFSWREQELKVTRPDQPRSYKGLGGFGSPDIAAKDIASIRINEGNA